MMTTDNGKQLKYHCITIEDLVPTDHLLRKIDRLINFSFIYDEVKELYCKNNGRPSIDPVMLIKYLLIGFIYGIVSERRIEQEIQVNVAYRWFLRLDLNDKVPDHTTISQNRRRRFNGKSLFRKIFEKIVLQCIENNLVDGKIILTDSSHVKAHASKKSETKIEVEKAIYEYEEILNKYETEERQKHDFKARTPKEDYPKHNEKISSTTDPDSGYLKRGHKPRGMHYLNHQSIDPKNGIIVDTFTTAANVNDCSPYLKRIDYIKQTFGFKIDSVGVDSGYNIGIIHKVLSDNGSTIFTPPRKPTKKCNVEFGKDSFRYQGDKDCYICPEDKIVPFKHLERGENLVNKVYIATTEDCKCCRHREKCVAKSNKSRIVRRNIFQDIVDKNLSLKDTEAYKRILTLRQIWCEGTFGTQKQMHNLKYLFRKGIEAATDHCLLSATALNLKRLVRCLG